MKGAAESKIHALMYSIHFGLFYLLDKTRFGKAYVSVNELANARVKAVN